MFEVKLPIAYKIKAMEVADGKWHMEYIEEFHDVPMEVIEENIKVMNAHAKHQGADLSAKAIPDGRGVIIFFNGTKDQILGFLAAEFIGVCPVGDMQIKELFALITMAGAGTELVSQSEPQGDNHG